MSEKKVKLAGVGRFQVMALLQAARHYVLHGDQVKAKSFGLNRAIFYAAAKRGFKKARLPARPIKTREELREKPILRAKNVQFLGDEAAFVMEVGGKIYFTIGGKPQTEEDFRRQIESRFTPIFDKIWAEALEIVREFDPEILLSQRGFFNEVYKPLRDELAEKWSKMVEEAQKSS